MISSAVLNGFVAGATGGAEECYGEETSHADECQPVIWLPHSIRSSQCTEHVVHGSLALSDQMHVEGLTGANLPS